MTIGDKTPASIEVLTFGCRLNSYESQVMVREAKKAGLGALEGGAVLVNTCAVTAEAVRQAKQAIRRARRERPGAKIIVTGCAAQTNPGSFGDMDEVDLVLGNEEKLQSASYRALPEFGVNDTEKIRVNDIMSIRETASHMIDYVAGRARAFVQVQNGCDHRCTFCIIPYGRGNSRSVPMGAVVEQVKRLVGNGYGEVVITGVDTTSYGADLPGNPSLGELVQKILHHVPDLKRLRLSSIDSIEVDEPLLEAIAGEQRFMPHLHLSQQSGDDMILKRMKRRHLRDHSIEFCQQVRALRPDMVFGADLIAGFPTENEAMFENTLAIIDECGFTHLHVFPYSSREGTPAARMPQLEKAIIKQRAGRLRQKGDEVLKRHLDGLIGREVELLVERGNRGHLADFTAAIIDDCNGGEIAPGT
ncbi:MAG: tRNA (N(6)-L-threonylcarbamoyladenosine(37)-C(2))-methylthiotransferase MtaB, partial [Rhizobiaceae bacterium]|nr:tRNA (N(6)-L-threonylcarbamoyladenosine(37)-C(2))-methylthiotransferase MtaB [Rhizobiaceae bacterium]